MRTEFQFFECFYYLKGNNIVLLSLKQKEFITFKNENFRVAGEIEYGNIKKWEYQKPGSSIATTSNLTSKMDNFMNEFFSFSYKTTKLFDVPCNIGFIIPYPI